MDRPVSARRRASPSVLKIGLIFGFGGLRDGVDKQKFKLRDSLLGNFLDLLIQGCGLWA